MSHKPEMNGPRKSDGVVVPTKAANFAGQPASESPEGRTPAKEHAGEQSTHRTPSRASVDTALERVRQAAKRDKGVKLTALMHHVTLERLRSAYLGMNRDAAAGIDGVTWQAYGVNLEDNLQDLLNRVHRGSYRASPTRRVYIPKADGRQRPLGVATLEDKLLQRAVAEVMNGIYEEDFLGFSYGFRPRRSQHHALDALAYGLCKKKMNWVLDADIRGFFDAIDHGWLIRFVEHRIGDKRLVRLLQKWLRAGVMENGSWTETDSGTAQGAAISPLLANVYLHYVLDLWVQQWRKRHARGEMIIVRYADDFVVGFERQEDGEQFQKDLGERLAQFKLELHPDKTRLIEFGRYAAERREARGQSKPETFTFLGLTHISGKASNGGFQLLRHTSKPRLRSKLLAVKAECRRRMHMPIGEQGKYLKSVLNGYYQYHAVPTNERALRTFRAEVQSRWKRVLSDRSQRGYVTWERMHVLSQYWLPRPKILHPWPEKRFADRLQGRSPVR